jgi:hypothetical protein
LEDRVREVDSHFLFMVTGLVQLSKYLKHHHTLSARCAWPLVTDTGTGAMKRALKR